MRLEKEKSHGISQFLPFEKRAEHYKYLMKSDKFVPFGRPQSCKVIIQVMTECCF